MKKLSLFFLLVLGASVLQAQVRIIGHRGASADAPENTVASATKAWEQGADAVEVDVYLTADKKVMVIHDGNTRRTSGRSFDVLKSSSDTLRLLEVGSYKAEEFRGEKIPFLEEVIATVPEGKQLVIEIKSDEKILPYLKEVVEKSGKKKQMVFICFNLTTIVEARTYFPKNECYWLCAFKGKAKKNMVKVARAGLNGVNLRGAIVDEKIMEKAAKYKLDVLAWTIDEPEDAKALIGLGVKAITTNKPGWMRAELAGELITTE
ncbi:MAG: glycerophosphodiester phosphodiesterase family protein [Bacteroidota bacterium]